MTNPTPDPGAIATAGKLTDALNGMRDELRTVNAASEKRDAELQQYGRRNRIIGVGAVVFTVIDVIATVVAIVAVVVAAHASNRAAVAEANSAISHRVAESQHAQLIAGCRASNELKARQETVWTFIEQFLGPKPGDSPAKRAASEQFLDALKQHVSQAYLARDCERAFPAPAPAATKAAASKPAP